MGQGGHVLLKKGTDPGSLGLGNGVILTQGVDLDQSETADDSSLAVSVHRAGMQRGEGFLAGRRVLID